MFQAYILSSHSLVGDIVMGNALKLEYRSCDYKGLVGQDWWFATPTLNSNQKFRANECWQRNNLYAGPIGTDQRSFG